MTIYGALFLLFEGYLTQRSHHLYGVVFLRLLAVLRVVGGLVVSLWDHLSHSALDNAAEVAIGGMKLRSFSDGIARLSGAGLRTLALVSLATFSHSLWAVTYTDAQNLVYTYTAVVSPSIGTATVTSSVGATGSITIPASFTAGSPAVIYNVTSITASAFLSRTAITSITIPTSVTNIGNLAFSGCTGLTGMTIPEGVATIGSSAFLGCTGITSITIPSTVTSIVASPFYGCTALTTITVDSANSFYSSLDGLLYNKLRTTLIQYPPGKSGSDYAITSGVTTIGANAFSGSTMLTSVTIPASVTSISTVPFLACNALNSITVDSGNLNYSSDSGVLFNKLKTTLIEYPTGKTNTAYTIPGTVTSVGTYAFYGCTILTSVTIPSSVTSIGTYAFNSCTSLTGVSLPNTVTSIGTNAFQYCSGLTSITIPSNATLTALSTQVFGHCSGLTSLTIPSTITTIGIGSFQNCTGLTSITIPSTVTSLLASAFNACTNVTSLVFSPRTTALAIGAQAFYALSRLTSVAIPGASGPSTLKTTIGVSAFAGCPLLSSVTIETGVASVEGSAFLNCLALSSIVLPDTITSIGASAFSGCGVLSSVILPTNALFTSIEASTFTNCNALTSITIPSSVTSIGASAFSGGTKLRSVSFLGNLPTVGTSAFTNVTAGGYYLSTATGWSTPFGGLPMTSVTSMAVTGDFNYVIEAAGAKVISYTGTATTVSIPSTLGGAAVTSIGGSAFLSSTLLTSVTIPSGVTSIGDNAFKSNTVLTKVTIPSSVTSIGASAFNSCSRLGAINFLGNAPTLGLSAFLNTVAAGYYLSSTTGWSNPSGDLSMTAVTIMATEGDYDYVDAGAGAMITRYLGAGGAVTAPSTLGGRVLTSIGSTAFLYSTALTSMTIPSAVTTIGSNAFVGCTSLTATTIPSTVTSIGASAFSGCTVLASVTLPPSLTSIADATFQNCRGLTSVTIPSAVTSIGISAFSGCTGLTTASIPSSVTSIGASAFSGCTVLSNVTLPRLLTSIADRTFLNCPGLAIVTIPSTVTSIGTAAFSGCTGLTTVYFQGDAPAGITGMFTSVSAAGYRASTATGWTSPYYGLTMTAQSRPTVTTPTSASIATTTATLGGTVSAAGDTSLTGVGVVYAPTASNPFPQLDGTSVTNLTSSAATGVMALSATGLTAGTGYSYAAYATNSVGTTYTSVSAITTGPVPTLSFVTPTAATVAYGATLTNAATSSLSGGSYGAISYASSAPSIATINATTGLVTTMGAGTTTITATQALAAGYNDTASQTYVLTVSKATPTVPSSPSASSITYGQTLASSNLSGGSASVSGAFAFTTPSTAPNAGTTFQGVTFTPSDTTNYNATTTTVNVTVAKATPTITGTPTATGISYGQTLASSTLIGGTASVGGTFTFTTTSTSPSAGTAAQGVTFTPTDTTNYTSTTTTANVTVAKATPTLTWATPSAITYGTALSATQLNASGSVAGAIVYSPASGTTPSAGTQTLTATFTPADTANYNTASGTVSLVVGKATPTVTWATPSAITYGTTLTATQLNATSSLAAGAITYSPASGTTPSAGTQTLTATFTPTDTANYNTATVTVSLIVNKATPAVTWATPSAITYGTALSATQLNATASVAGTFAYSPASGSIPSVGTQTLSATFTPTDSANYNSASATVLLTVIVAVPGAPTSISTTTANGEATVTFNAPSNIGSSAITGYTIRATATDGSTVMVNASGSPAKVTGLTPGKSYRFSVTANNSAGSSDTSPTSDAITISLVNQTITFASLADRTSNSGSFTLAATASSGLPVTFTVVSGPALLSGNVVDLTGATGTVKIRASQTGNATYAAATDVDVAFAITTGQLQVIFGKAVNSESTAPMADLAIMLRSTTRTGSILLVSNSIPGLNGAVDFTLTTGGGFSTTLVTTASNVTPLDSGIQAAPATYTITGTLLNSVFSGTISPLGLVFRANVTALVGPTAAVAGFYKSTALLENSGVTYSVIGANNEVLALTQNSTVTAGGLTNLKSDNTFSLTVTTTSGNAMLNGSINSSTTTAYATLAYSGATVNFAGLSVTTTPTDRLINLSSRAKVGTGESVLITGFVIGGTDSKKVLIRAAGPALSAFGLASTLPNPAIKIYQGSNLIAQNDDWNKDDAAEISRLGAFAFAAGSKDAALLTTLAPGAYTAQITDPSGTGTGVALAEIYDASINPNADFQRLVNISSRGRVTPDDGVLIGGFVVRGNSPKTLLIRGIGPALTNFGIAGALADPALTIYQDSKAISTNEGWANRAAITTAAIQTGAFMLPAGSKDAAVVITLNPGAYTAQIKSAKNASSGVALIEIYEVP